MKRLIVCGVILALVGSAHAQNLLNYGDFETGETGGPGTFFYYPNGENIPVGDTSSWVVTDGDNTAVVMLGTPYSGMSAGGDQVLHIGDALEEGGLAQSFTTDIGQTYNLSLLAWNWVGNGTGFMDISVGDLVVDDLPVPSYDDAGPVLLEYSFMATDTTSTLHIYNNAGSGLSIDDVVVEIPEPATICLLGLGGLLARRKR